VSLLFHRSLSILLTFVSVFLITVPAEALRYTVETSDTLYGLSRHFEIPLNWIIRANKLENETIHPGQSLQIPLDGIHSLEIRAGDTLSALAVEFGVSEDYLRRYNSLESGNLRIGQKLNIPPPLNPGIYEVLPGDTLLGIAIRQGIDVDKLRMYNSLSDDIIHPGQKLTVIPPRPEGYEVGAGESLWTIARKYSLSTDDIKLWNNITGDVIHPGELLVLYPGIKASEIHLEPVITLASAPRPHPENPGVPEKEILPQKGEYYFSYPRVQNQPGNSYWESPDASAATDYRRARSILELFRTEIASIPKTDYSLKGWHIVIDPGHGGLDPGAIVTVADGNGNPVVITEDEYAYDISMRLYRALYRYGASVSLTVIAPDHQIRDGIDARQTFVHRKNEVYNKASQNTVTGWRPVGTTEGLDLRKTIASEQIEALPSSAKQNGTLYISIHADNTPELPEGTAVLFDGGDEDEKSRSMALAESLVPFLGNGSFIHNQPLRVLDNNPADASVLIEVRNLHYTRNAWALRSAELREQDALRIADGIRAWADKK